MKTRNPFAQGVSSEDNIILIHLVHFCKWPEAWHVTDSQHLTIETLNALAGTVNAVMNVYENALGT